MDLPEVTEVKRLTVRPGDRLVLLVDRELDVQTGEELGRQVKQILKVTCPVLVLPRGIGIEVLSGEEDGA